MTLKSSYLIQRHRAYCKFKLSYISNWAVKTKLQIHPTKAKLMFIGSSYNRNNKVCDHPVLINESVPRTDTYKCLGVEIDEKLHREKHIETICKNVANHI